MVKKVFCIDRSKSLVWKSGNWSRRRLVRSLPVIHVIDELDSSAFRFLKLLGPFWSCYITHAMPDTLTYYDILVFTKTDRTVQG